MKNLSILLLITVLFHWCAGLAQASQQLHCFYIGSYSLDDEQRSFEDKQKAIEAIEEQLPWINCLAVAMYLDYPQQIAEWFEIGHDRGYVMQLRSAGFDAWQGTNESADPTMTPSEYVARLPEWISEHCEMFADGDAMEAVPDEPSNGDYWEQYEQGVASAKLEFNQFIIDAVLAAQNAFAACGKEVDVAFVTDSPSVIRDILAEEVDGRPGALTVLGWVGTNNHPPCTQVSVDGCIDSLREEIIQWVADTHEDIPWMITFGLAESGLSDHEYADAYAGRYEAIVDDADHPLIVTLYQFGDESNTFADRLFDYHEGEWMLREGLAGRFEKFLFSVEPHTHQQGRSHTLWGPPPFKDMYTQSFRFLHPR